MNALRSVLLVCFFGVVLSGGVLWTGWQPGKIVTEPLKPSIRANPGSYRPTYASHTGFQKVRRASGGGGGGGVVYVGGGSRSSGGGYGYGK